MRLNHLHPLAPTFRATAALVCVLLLSASCTKNSGSTPGPHLSLTDYKKSNHHLFVGYLVADGNDPAAGYNPANAPDSADFLEFFAGHDANVADWRVAQAKGTRIVECHFVNNAYFDGSAKDPATQVPGYVNPPGFSQTAATSTSTYDHWARDMYKKLIDTMGINGIDIDIESGTFGNDVPYNVTGCGENLMISVAKYFGPNCTLCKTDSLGRKPVLFYDTDGSSKYEAAMYTNHQSNYDYVLFQSYTTGNHYWRGSTTADFAPLVSYYGLNKLIFLVNGDSFIYPDGHQDVAGGDAKASSDLASFSQWVKDNNGVGTGVYRMSRDYNHTPPFAVSRKAIQTMNPYQ